MRNTYYDEILECIELEDLSKHIDAQWDEVAKMEKGYKKYSISTWLKWFGYYLGCLSVLFLFQGEFFYSLCVWVPFLFFFMLRRKKNQKFDESLQGEIDALKQDIERNRDKLSSQYRYMESRFNSGDFSISKDCWFCGHELMKYYKDNRAFSFEEARYYVDKRLDREAAERGLKNAYSRGYSDGQSSGYSQGYNAGESAGYVSGRNSRRW